MNDLNPELIKMIPKVLWFLFVLGAIILFYRPIHYQLIPKFTGIKAMGVELSFLKESIDAALSKAKDHDEKIELAEKSQKWKVEVPSEDKKLVISRALQHLKILHGAQILWVDDCSENNLNERKMFKQLNVEIDTARSNAEALAILNTAKYDVILSDMDRENNPTAGLEFLKELRTFDAKTPVIFYIGVYDAEKGIPPKSFGITNRPDELLHLTLDALERQMY